MRAKEWKLVSYAALGVGLLLLAATIVLPNVKTDQKILAEGPVTPYDGANYTISGYFIPPVDRGTNITILLTGYEPGKLELSFFPTQDHAVQPAASPLISIANLTAPASRASVTSPDSQPYGILISSFNRTSFLLQVDSIWSPYYDLAGYVPPAVFVLIASSLSASYFARREKVEELERRALDAAKKA